MSFNTYEFLEHFGVKGMKWGVVNEDEPSGVSSSRRTTKPKDKTKNSGDPVLAKQFKKFSDQQKYGSMNDPEQKIEDQPFYKKLTPAQKKAAYIFGGAVVVAGLAYGAHKYDVFPSKDGKIDPRSLLKNTDPFDDLPNSFKEGLSAYKDRGIELPSGSLVGRVSGRDETVIRAGGFFAAHERHDIQAYQNWLGSVGGYTNYYQATKPIKAPSAMEYARLLGQAMDDPEILRARGLNVKQFNKLTTLDREKVLTRLATQELSRHNFAHSLNESTVTGKLPQRFVKNVLDSGYTSVIDFNNTSGGIAQAPMRHLDGSMFKKVSSEPITAELKQLLKLDEDSYMDIIADFYDGVKHFVFGLINGKKNKFLSHKQTQSYIDSAKTYLGADFVNDNFRNWRTSKNE